jgi:hypothetical protein
MVGIKLVLGWLLPEDKQKWSFLRFIPVSDPASSHVSTGKFHNFYFFT